MSNKLIICGYPGIGKSSIAGWDHCIDLESSKYTQSTIPLWPELYCKTAIELAKQDYTVFVSTHSKVIRYLHDHQIELKRAGVYGPFLVYPDQKLQYQWLTKLLQRFQTDQTSKNYRAYERAKEHWEEDIAFLDSYAPSHSYVIHDAKNYSFKSIVEELRNRTESVIVQTNLVDNELWQAKGD